MIKTWCLYLLAALVLLPTAVLALDEVSILPSRKKLDEDKKRLDSSSSEKSKEISYSVKVTSRAFKELQNVTMVTASLTTHSREMAVAITEQKLTLEEMGDKVQSIAAKGAEYAFSLEDVTGNIEKLAGSDGIIASNLAKVALNTKASSHHLEVLANNLTATESGSSFGNFLTRK